MEKLTSILVVVEGVESGTKVLEKAMVLARGFGARVELLSGDDRDLEYFASLCTARGYKEVMLCSVSRCAQSFEDVILRRVFETSPDLVVKGLMSGSGGDTRALSREDQHLAAACPVPLVLMRGNAWSSPVRIAAAVDVSKETGFLEQSIVHTAGFLSLGLEAALDVIYSEREKQDEVLRMARAVKLARMVREFHVEGERVRRIEGAPEEALIPIVASDNYDVLILGAVTHRSGLAAMHGSLTRKLVNACKGDVVLIKEELRGSDSKRQAPFKSRAAL